MCPGITVTSPWPASDLEIVQRKDFSSDQVCCWNPLRQENDEVPIFDSRHSKVLCITPEYTPRAVLMTKIGSGPRLVGWMMSARMALRRSSTLRTYSSVNGTNTLANEARSLKFFALFILSTGTPELMLLVGLRTMSDFSAPVTTYRIAARYNSMIRSKAAKTPPHRPSTVT